MVLHCNDDLKGKSGVYSITNSVNDKIYIGSSKNLTNRYRQHRRQIKIGAVDNKNLQELIDNYNFNSFQFNILELTSVDTLLIKEKAYIANFKPICLNILGVQKNGRTKVERIQVQLPSCRIRDIKKLSKKMGISLSSCVSFLIEKGLNNRTDDQVLKIVKGSRVICA